MAVAIRSSATLAFGSGRTTSTLTAPAGIANGDVLLAILSVGAGVSSAVAVTPPAGWTAAAGSPFFRVGAGPYTISVQIFTKTAASESGSYAFTHASAGTEGIVYALSGANTTTPISPAVTTDTDDFPGINNGQTTDYVGLTTPVDGCLIVAAEAMWDDTTGMTALSGSTPTFTQRFAGTIFYVCDGVLATAGATGAKSHTNGNNSVSGPWVSTLVSVQAVTAGPPPDTIIPANGIGTGAFGPVALFADEVSADSNYLAALRRRRKRKRETGRLR